MGKNLHFASYKMRVDVVYDSVHASKGEHSWEDTAEVRVLFRYDLSPIIDEWNMRKYLDYEGKLNDVTNPYNMAYSFAFVPAGLAEDFIGTMSKKYGNGRTPVEKKEERRPDFQRMYQEFEDKYNPYPVQMSRCDAFGHAFRDGLIDSDMLRQAREFYGSLWNYTGD